MSKKIRFFYNLYDYNNLENFLIERWKFNKGAFSYYNSIQNSKWFYLSKNSDQTLYIILDYKNYFALIYL